MEIVIRASVVFWFVWLIARGLGKRELAEMSPFELILLVMVGDLVQQGVTQEDFSIVGSMLAVGTLAAWILGLSVTAYHFPWARRALDGSPVILLRDGRPDSSILRYERLDHQDLEEAAREQGIADLSSVRMVVLEPNGKFSFLTDAPSEPKPPDDRHRI